MVKGRGRRRGPETVNGQRFLVTTANSTGYDVGSVGRIVDVRGGGIDGNPENTEDRGSKIKRTSNFRADNKREKKEEKKVRWDGERL